MSLFHVFLVVSSAVSVSVMLQGCGGGGGGGGDKPSPGPTPKPSPAPKPKPTPPRTKPHSEKDIVDWLNTNYMGFDNKNDSSPLGVYISMVAKEGTFFGNIFCSSFSNPRGATKCYNGQADCRMSASLYNHKSMVSEDGEAAVFAPGLNRYMGIIFNNTQIETYSGKCAYIWDGASANNVNRGCGNGGKGGGNCDNKHCAFNNICDSMKTCTVDDLEVKTAFCKDYGGTIDIPPTHDGNPQCVFPGAAIDYTGEDPNWEPNYYKQWHPHPIRAMAKKRIDFMNTAHPPTALPNIQEWNEVVVDEKLLLSDTGAGSIWQDPAPVIPAFVYMKKGGPHALLMAKQMRDDFCKFYKVDDIPVVMIDNGNPFGKSGPFKVPADEDAADITV